MDTQKETPVVKNAISGILESTNSAVSLTHKEINISAKFMIVAVIIWIQNGFLAVLPLKSKILDQNSICSLSNLRTVMIEMVRLPEEIFCFGWLLGSSYLLA